MAAQYRLRNFGFDLTTLGSQINSLINWAYRLQSGCSYLIAARTRYFLHSPFVYDFYEKVLCDSYYKKELVKLKAIETLRRTLDQQSNFIPRYQTQADGSLLERASQPLKRILRRESCPTNIGAFFFRFTSRYQPTRILELGTHMGLAALYLQAGYQNANYLGVEGNPHLVKMARQHFQQFGFRGQVIESTFKDFFNEYINLNSTFDLIYFDGDHRGEALLNYCERLLYMLRPGGCLILDDIRWSRAMFKGWRQVCQLEQVSISIELFRLGLLFVGRQQAREHFVLWSPYGV